MKKYPVSKKEFIENSRIDKYGNHTNAIFYDHEHNGFKYLVWCDNRVAIKDILIDVMMDWVFNEVQPPLYVCYKYAKTDEERFKIPLTLKY